ncbi:hypothetical protein C8Q74DRAFT_1366170 [Fomes fomentarius]|nr:hypothetical protein C8Q74DRAFT_1366170 [Fomes fomentarius]
MKRMAPIIRRIPRLPAHPPEVALSQLRSLKNDTEPIEFDPLKISHILRPLATFHWLREVTPDVFASKTVCKRAALNSTLSPTERAVYAALAPTPATSAELKSHCRTVSGARKHGLDVEHVTVVTAERTIEKAFTILPPVKGPLPSIIGLEPAPTDAEWLLVRSIEWTTFVKSTYDTALEQADVILRYLLGLIEQAREDTIKLLTTDWLMADVEVNDGERRRRDLVRIRQIYIPEPIIRLHSILVTSRSQTSENVKHALSARQHGRRFALQVVR